nr:hypothetical protein [Nitrosomonas nitrosa]
MFRMLKLCRLSAAQARLELGRSGLYLRVPYVGAAYIGWGKSAPPSAFDGWGTLKRLGEVR